MRAGNPNQVSQNRRRRLTVLAGTLCLLGGCRSSDQSRTFADTVPNPIQPLVAQVKFDEDLPQPQSIEATIDPDGMIDVDSDDSPVQIATANALDQLESLAVSRHPYLVAARSRVEVARGQHVQAGLPYNPVLQYQSDEIGNDDATGLHSVRLSQQFITAGKLDLAQQAQAHAVAVRKADMRRAELQVLTGVRIAFARAWIAQQRAQLTQQIVELNGQSVNSAKQLLEAQEVSKVTLLQAQVEAEQAKIAAENAVIQLTAHRRALAAAIGVESLAPTPIVGDMLDSLSEKPWEALVEQITVASPELMAAGSRFQQARWALRLACAQVTPNVTGQVGVGYDAVSDDTFATIGVSVPLPIRNRNQGNIYSARAEVASTSAATESTRLDLQSRLAAAVGRFETARQRHQRLSDRVLPSAEETFALSRSAFEAGESDYLQLLTAQRTLVATKVRILDALGQAREASAEIDGLLVTVQ